MTVDPAEGRDSSASGSFGPVGGENQRVLTDEEQRVLKKLLLGDPKRPVLGFQLLGGFASFAANNAREAADKALTADSDVEVPERSSISIGAGAAIWALSLRWAAEQETWPANITPPGALYEYMEEWLMSISVDEAAGERVPMRIGQLTTEEYLRS